MYSSKNQWEQLLFEVRVLALNEDKIETFEDLRDLLAIIGQQKKLAKAKEQAGAVGSAAKNLMGLIPGIGQVKSAMELAGNVKDIAQMAKSVMNADDETADKSPVLDMLNIDDKYSEILDDRLETEFIDKLSNKIENDQGPIPDNFSVTKVLEDWLENSQSDRTVVGADTDPHKTIKDVEIPPKFTQAKNKFKSVASGFFDGFF